MSQLQKIRKFQVVFGGRGGALSGESEAFAEYNMLYSAKMFINRMWADNHTPYQNLLDRCHFHIVSLLSVVNQPIHDMSYLHLSLCKLT